MKPLEDNEIEITSVAGGELIGLGNGCAYYQGNYHESKTVSHYGKALAIFRPNSEGTMVVKAKSKYGEVELSIPVTSK